MKIGIITYHHYDNYGTMLQALALQKAIEKLGCECEIIDYHQSVKPKGINLIKMRFQMIPTYIRNFKKYYVVKKSSVYSSERHTDFEEFYKEYLKVSNESYSSFEDLLNNPPKYDFYVVGSDQTWNPNVGANRSPFYLKFVKDSSKKGSYAPSVGLSALSSKHYNELKEGLKDFKWLSCREKTGAELLKKVTGKDIPTVLDPTLLLKDTEWNKYEVSEVIRKPYILMYFLGERKDCREYVTELSKKYNLEIVTLPHNYVDLNKIDGNSKFIGPGKFLNLIKNAELICTDSFHGTAFSINYKKPFYSFCKRKEKESNSDNSRIPNLLEALGLEDRLISDSVLKDNYDIDYSLAEIKLNDLRNRSLDYLSNMLNETFERED